MESTDLAALQQGLLAWYEKCRRDLPWRTTRDPWAIWVSEIMLQQTRVDTVIPYYGRFLSRFPTALALAEAPVDDVLAAWSGLGYYRRARLLHAGARDVARDGMPSTRERLLAVSGIGRYTAGAIASIAFGEVVGLVDGNVARVLARIFAIDDDMRKTGQRRAEVIADAIVSSRDPGGWNQALMELGATICTPRAPRCTECPVATMCKARLQGREEQLPVLSKKKPPAVRSVQAIVATRGRSVVLARRRGDGLFGGLWEPPWIEGDARSRRRLTEPLESKAPVHVGTIEHVLSHRRLRVDVLTASVVGNVDVKQLPSAYDDVCLVGKARLRTLGVSTFARKILACAGFVET